MSAISACVFRMTPRVFPSIYGPSSTSAWSSTSWRHWALVCCASLLPQSVRRGHSMHSKSNMTNKNNNPNFRLVSPWARFNSESNSLENQENWKWLKCNSENMEKGESVKRNTIQEHQNVSVSGQIYLNGINLYMRSPGIVLLYWGEISQQLHEAHTHFSH